LSERTEILKSSYPVGAQALLPAGVRRRRAAEDVSVAILQARGFEEIVLPIIDFVDPYDGAIDPDLLRRSYRFIDRQGDVIAVRSDFTPMVARAVAPHLADLQLPLRLFYRGDVVRQEPARLRADRAHFQIGAELVGGSAVEGDLAMLGLAVELVVAATGARPLVVISDPRIAQRVVSGEVPGVFERLVTGRASVEELVALPETEELARALVTLRERVAAMTGADAIVALDGFDEPSYYTGPRFLLFDARTRLRIGAGGRYDELYGRFGAPAPATGFTLDCFDGESS
jgi:ATP phosphoribosyltransferase regulatory subunit HisZ